VPNATSAETAIAAPAATNDFFISSPGLTEKCNHQCLQRRQKKE